MSAGMHRIPAETVKKLLVIANQSADWCGDPLVHRKNWVF